MREQLNSLGLCFNWDRVSREKSDTCVSPQVRSLTTFVQSANLASFHNPNYWLWCSELMLPWCFLRHMLVKVTGYHVNRQLVFPVLTKKMPHSSRADTLHYLAYGEKNILVIFMPAVCTDWFILLATCPKYTATKKSDFIINLNITCN